MSRSCYVMSDGTWDREYLRVTAIYRLMKHGHIDVAGARELAARPIRGVPKKHSAWLHNTIDIWARVFAREAA